MKEFIFVVKPLLAFTPVIIPWPNNFLFLLIYALIYLKKMYLTPVAIKDPRIIFLPIITVFLLYYEVFWMIESYLYLRKTKI